MSITKLIPDFQDEVRNTVSGVSGTVDACYTENGILYLDVIIDPYTMKYRTPASNWEVVTKYVE